MLNQMKTFILMLALTLVLIWVGNLVGGRQGMIFAFIIAAGMNFISYWYSDKIVLAMYRAQPLTEDDMPQLYRHVSVLTQKSGLPMPKLYLIPHPAPNAFATGRNPQHAAVAVTEGILRVLDEEELAGVIGHELAHVRNRDILIQTVAATIAGAVMILAFIARWAVIFRGYGSREDKGGGAIGLLVAAIVAPVAAMIIQMAISRSREYLADRGSALVTGNPLGLARALRKLEASASQRRLPAHQSTAHMFTVNPLRGGGLAVLFSTHPPIQKRIERLEKMA
ncbi:MAG: zinc metalloprotease HtpX [bacterium]